MREEYKAKLKGFGVDVGKLPVEKLWTSADGRWVTPVIFDKSIFAEIGEAGTVATVTDVMNRRICDKYGLLSEEFEVARYFGNGFHQSLTAIVYIEKDVVGKVMKQVEIWCN